MTEFIILKGEIKLFDQQVRFYAYIISIIFKAMSNRKKLSRKNLNSIQVRKPYSERQKEKKKKVKNP